MSTLGQRFADALQLAHQLHTGQTRKASEVPYISHSLAVASLVLEYGGDEDTAIAALLHDAFEDCGGARIEAEVRRRFGSRVADIVLGCSDTLEQPKPPWRPRKERYLEHLTRAEPEVLLVSAADKLHNLTSLLREERRLGDELWGRFRAGRDGTLWYYGRLIEIFRNSPLPGDLLEALEEQFRALAQRLHH